MSTKAPYWKKIRIQYPTGTLGQYNEGDLTDTVLDLFYYIGRAFTNHGIAHKGKPLVQFSTAQGTFELSDNRPGEMMEMTIEVSAPPYKKEVLESELEKMEMREGFEFYEMCYGQFVLSD